MYEKVHWRGFFMLKRKENGIFFKAQKTISLILLVFFVQKKSFGKRKFLFMFCKFTETIDTGLNNKPYLLRDISIV